MEKTKTFNSCWKTRLRQELNHIPAKINSRLRLVLLGVGNELRGDDAAGLRVAGLLAERFAGNESVMAQACGPAPENFTQPIRRFDPDVVIYIDAAELGAAPGVIQVVLADGLAAVAPSTHTWSPVMLFDYLQAEIGCQCVLLAIQAGDARLDQPLSREVSAAVTEAVEGLADVISPFVGG